MDNSNLKKIEIEQKINNVLRALGLSFAEGFRIIRYNPKVRTACWKYYPATGDEAIELGDSIVSLTQKQIEMVLRHEFLHRSVYHGFGEQFDDPQTSNIVLDICINRLLFEAFPKDMKELSKAIYPQESKTSIIALADCSADPYILKEPYRSLWKSIWKPEPDGIFQNLNPASLYFRLVELFDPVVLILNPFSDFSQIDPGFSGNIPARIIKAGSKIAQGISRKLPYGSSGGEGLDQYSVVPQQIGINNVEQFLQRINIKTVTTKFAAKIKEPLQSNVNLQPYPLFPSRVGYIYQIFGLTDTLRMYWNKQPEPVGVRLAIGLYVDVSGSMIDHFPLVSGFVDALKDYPIKIYAFDTKVREINIEEFCSGKIKGGGGTDFDCVINNFLSNQELIAAVIFTDGDGTLSDPVGRDLKISRRNIYLIRLKTETSSDFTSILQKYSKDTLVVEIKNSKYIIIKQAQLWKN